MRTTMWVRKTGRQTMHVRYICAVIQAGESEYVCVFVCVCVCVCVCV